ncbi:MAG: hypothetical protein CVU56_26870 [Deltaproteobacteria bacterium HGW-Deltaproteobacteria-14]|jgi:hypothetical protein|nr:MAG: hypothetical protein CVU56_26870 [Deltaproteobacteria bacterium HGW-Deltaproteobacteria-14]
MRTRAAALALATCLAWGGSAAAVDVSVSVGGGTLLAWDAPSQIGNAFGGGLFLGVGAFEVGVAGAVIFPDSRVQGDFGAVWAEGRWYPFGRETLWSPWLSVGLGVATDDGLDPRTIDAIAPVRWVTGGPSALALAGVGLRYGETTGLYLALDVRAYNHTHGGIDLTVGYAF